MSETTYQCGARDCNVEVKGVYCPRHRELRAAARRVNAEARAAAMRERWEKDREGMLARLAAGKAPVSEDGVRA